MFVICVLICFIIHGEAVIDQQVEIDSSKDFSSMYVGTSEVLPMESKLQHPKDQLLAEIYDGRAKQRLIKGKLNPVLKTLILFKLILFFLSLPLSTIAAKILAWNAIALSLFALVSSKLVLLRSMFPGSTGLSTIPPSPPIIIQSSSDPTRQRRGGPKIYIQQDPLISDVEEEAHHRKRW